MATDTDKSIFTFSKEDQKSIVQNRGKLIEAIKDLELLAPNDPDMMIALERAKSALHRTDGLYKVMVKYHPEMAMKE